MREKYFPSYPQVFASTDTTLNATDTRSVVAMHSTAVTYETLELEEHQSLSPSELVYNKARGTKKFCIGALCFSALVGSGFIVVGGVAKGFAQTFHLTSFELELIPFCINILVLIATEANGYVSCLCL